MASLADLETRLAKLEKAARETEALVPNYLTINPDGTVSATFTGKVVASELDLVASGSTPSPINWVTTGGTKVADLQSDASGNLELDANSLVIKIGGAISDFILGGHAHSTGNWYLDSGDAVIPIGAGGVSGAVTVNFSAHALFTGPPNIVTTNNGNNNIVARCSSITSSQFLLTAFWSDGANTHGAANPDIMWLALGN